jgi:hypothetical protein
MRLPRYLQKSVGEKFLRSQAAFQITDINRALSSLVLFQMLKLFVVMKLRTYAYIQRLVGMQERGVVA